MPATLLLLAAAPVLAQTDRHVATSGTDSGSCTIDPCASISYALGQSDAGDTINVANGTYTEQLVIDKDIQIKGASRRFTILQAASDPIASPGRVVLVQAPPVGQPFRQVEISRMTIRHGRAQGPAPHNRGGGIYVEAGDLDLDNVTLASNRAQLGGGLYCANSLGWTLRNVRFENNLAFSGFGGGMYNNGCTVSINVASFENNSASSSAVSNGHGGALFNTNSSMLSLRRVDFIGNSAGYHGGAVFTNDNSAMTVVRSRFEGNSAVQSGGAIRHDENSLTISRTGFVNNTSGPTGGAMRIDNADVELANVRFLNNASSSGGSISSFSVEGRLVNALFLDNTANFGAGLYQTSSNWAVYNSTFSGNASNSGAAVFQNNGSLFFTNSIVWGNSGQIPGVEMVNSGGNGSMTISFSLIAMGCPNSASCNQVLNVNPQFSDPEAGNFELTAISPAVDTGNPGTQAAFFPVDAVGDPIDLNTDPRFVNSRIDMGAFEYQSVALPDPLELVSPPNTSANLGQPVTLVWSEMAQAEEYQVQVALASATFDDAFIDETLENTSLDLAGLEMDTGYQWRVKALAGGGFSAWSEIWTFRTSMGVLPGPGNIIHVSPSATGSHDGSSWENAVNELAWALRHASINRNLGQWSAENPLQIWVAAGTYLPQYRADFIQGDPIDHPDTAFVLIENVQVYGGFAGTESNLTQRNWRNNETTLSGGDTRNHVMIAAGDLGVGRLDGFTIRDGFAEDGASGSLISVNGQIVYRERGAGLYVVNSAPDLTNLKLKNNIALIYGGAIYNHGGSPRISNSEFLSNTVIGGFGAAFASTGGEPVLVNSLIVGNDSASGFAGGISVHGGATVSAVNLTLADNVAVLGGGLYIENGSLMFFNGVLWGNSALFGHQAYVEGDGSLGLNWVVFSDEEQDYYNEGDFDVVDGVAENPLFVHAASGKYQLQSGSPAIDGGANHIYNNLGGSLEQDLDLAGNPRLRNGVIDIGAYEFQDTSADDRIFSDRFAE